MDVKNFTKGITNSLNFLDNHYIYYIIVVILFLYNSLLFININDFFSNVYKFGIIRVIVLLLVLYTSQKSYLISLLLAMSYILSIYFDREKLTSTENFFNNEEENIPQGINDMINNDNSLTFDSAVINKNKMLNDQNAVNFDNKPESFSSEMGEEYNPKSFSNGMVGEQYESFTSDLNTNTQIMQSIPKSLSSEMSEEQFESFKMEHFDKNMSNENEKNIMKNTLSKTECIQNYNPKFESIGNICEPVATFENEFNAQGLNYPIGYNIK